LISRQTRLDSLDSSHFDIIFGANEICITS
jgi:hypothetical protein